MKKSFIIALMTISLLCGVLSTGLVSALDTGAADGPSISLSDDFTAIKNGESVGEVSNLVFDGNAEYGAVPGSAWGATVSGGDGSILYTLTANEGEVLTGGNVSFTAGGGHAGGVYWYNASNQLGANLKVSVSTDGNVWTELFDFDKTAGYVKTNDQASAASGRYSNTDSPLSLDAYIANSRVAYIRFDVEHFTAAETGISGWDETGIPLDKVGLCLYNIAIHADQGEEIEHVYDFNLSDDFTAIKNGESVGEVSNLVFDGNAEYGAVPGSAWGATVSGGDGSILYTLTANEGEVLTGGNVSFTAGGGHAGGVYWYNASNQLGANLKVSVSTDGNVWTELFDFDKTAGYVKTNDQASAASGRYSNTDSPLSLDAYIANSRVAYIRFDVEHFTAAETGISGWDQTGIPLGKVGLCLYNIAIHADQGELAGIELENDWTQGGSVGTFEGVIDWGGVVKDEAAGNKDYALIPAKVWGAVVDTCSGYLTYAISADRGLQMKDLALQLRFACFESLSQFAGGNADVKVQVSKDLVNWQTVYSFYEQNGMDLSFSLNDVKVNLGAYSDGYGIMYVKVVLQCPEVDRVALNQMPIILKEVHFTASQEPFAGKTEINHVFGNDKGTALSENYAGIVESDGVYDGNSTFGLIPSGSWGVEVNASNGYVVYKLTAPEGRMFVNLQWDIAYKMLEGSNLILSVGYDGENFTEFFDAAEVLGDRAYENLLVRPVPEAIPYRELSLNLYDAVRNKREVYVKVEILHPTETVALNALKAEIFEISVYSTTAEYEAVGNISYVLNGGAMTGEGNPTQYTQGQETIMLKSPEREYYTFAGWYESPDFSGEAVTEIDTSVLKDWNLYAKWEAIYYALDITVEGEGTLTNGDLTWIQAGETLVLEMEPAQGWLIYSLRIDGAEVFLTGGTTYTLRQVSEDHTIFASFMERTTLHGDFSIRYDESQMYGNEWKEGLYDFENLYITDESFHALGIDGGVGYITYKFAADGGRTFESATLVTEAKLFDFLGMQTNERVDYYISYDDSDYRLVYKSLLNKQGENFVTITQNLSEYVVGRTEFYLKVEVGSNSANWTLLKSLDIRFTYEVVELTIDYGDYRDVLYTQEKGTPLDLSQIRLQEGYVLDSDKIYTDKERTQEWDLLEPVTGDLVIYLPVTRVDGKIHYVLNDGTNNASNPEIYDSTSAVVLLDAVREGYVFAGWYADEACTLRVTEIAAGRTGDITLYAKWVPDSAEDIPVKWTIDYVLNGGQNTAANAPTYQTEKGFKLQAPTRVGYHFEGWYTDPDFRSPISEIAPGTQGPVTVYAKWTETEKAETGGCSGNIGMANLAAALAAGLAAAVLLRKRNAHKEGK